MLAENPLSFCLICRYKYFHNFIYFISRDIVIFGLAGNTGECEKLRPHQCVHSNLKKNILSCKVTFNVTCENLTGTCSMLNFCSTSPPKLLSPTHDAFTQLRPVFALTLPICTPSPLPYPYPHTNANAHLMPLCHPTSLTSSPMPMCPPSEEGWVRYVSAL
jgi:hypothetical protein